MHYLKSKWNSWLQLPVLQGMAPWGGKRWWGRAGSLVHLGCWLLGACLKKTLLEHSLGAFGIAGYSCRRGKCLSDSGAPKNVRGHRGMKQFKLSISMADQGGMERQGWWYLSSDACWASARQFTFLFTEHRVIGKKRHKLYDKTWQKCFSVRD